jgi:hypothetical protein
LRTQKGPATPGAGLCRFPWNNGSGGYLHLTDAVQGWLVPGKNPFGLYLYLEDVDALAAEFGSEIIGKNAPEDKPWGMYEFALSDPDQTLVRIGWPTRLRRSKGAGSHANSCFSIS